VQVEAGGSKPRVTADAPGREYELQRPFGWCVGELARQSVRQRDAAESGRQISLVLLYPAGFFVDLQKGRYS